MAAGVGRRLKALHGDKPKCLINAGHGETLIGRSVRLLQSYGIEDITVITGYESAQVMSHFLEEPTPGRGITWLHNPYYATTNSIASLALAEDKLVTASMKDSVLLLNADLYYEPAVLEQAICSKGRAVMLSDKTRIEDADFRFSVDGRSIKAASNKLSNEQTDCEYVGIARVDVLFLQAFRTRLLDLVAKGNLHIWWESVLYSFMEEGLPIYHQDVEGNWWTEVDDETDYNRLQTRIRLPETCQ